MKGMRGNAFVALAAISILAGCATTRSGSDSAGDSDLITREQIVQAENDRGARTLYEVVQRLRPRWLTVRAADRSFGMSVEIAVYQGQTYMGDVEVLRQMGPTLAYQLQWMDGQQAMNTLPGLGSGKHLAGAIIISTKPPQQ